MLSRLHSLLISQEYSSVLYYTQNTFLTVFGRCRHRGMADEYRQPFDDGEFIEETQYVGPGEVMHTSGAQPQENALVDRTCLDAHERILQRSYDASLRAQEEWNAKRRRLARTEKTMQALELQENELRQGITDDSARAEKELGEIEEDEARCLERRIQNEALHRKISGQKSEYEELRRELDEARKKVAMQCKEINDMAKQ